MHAAPYPQLLVPIIPFSPTFVQGQYITFYPAYIYPTSNNLPCINKSHSTNKLISTNKLPSTHKSHSTNKLPSTHKSHSTDKLHSTDPKTEMNSVIDQKGIELDSNEYRVIDNAIYKNFEVFKISFDINIQNSLSNSN